MPVENADGHLDGSQIGKKVILPSSFTGSPRYQHQLYQDAMAIVQWYGKPDFLITFTCNPRWKEITDAPPGRPNCRKSAGYCEQSISTETEITPK